MNPQLRSSSSSTSSYSRSTNSSRPKSQNLAELPPKHPGGKKRHSYHPSSNQSAVDGGRRGSGDVVYADLDSKAFMIPANHVLPPVQNRQTYAEISVSRSKIV